MPIIPLVIYAGLVLALLAAELREDGRGQRLFKPLAALGFILLAIYVGALETRYGQIILAGLIACAAGDVLLLSRKSENLFKAGMAAFALGHIFYILAFVNIRSNVLPEGADWLRVLPAMLVVVASIHILKKIPDNMQRPVMYYCFIIFIMVVGSFFVPLKLPFILASIGAVMFAISDMFVARDRFITPDPKNALAITPFYFGAQALFALSTAI